MIAEPERLPRMVSRAANSSQTGPSERARVVPPSRLPAAGLYNQADHGDYRD